MGVRPLVLTLVVLMACLPLPFGSFRSWSWNVAGVVIGACLASGVCGHAVHSVRWSLYIFLGVIVWSFVQILPFWTDVEGRTLAISPFHSLDHTLRLMALGALWMCGFNLSFTDLISVRHLSYILAHVGGVWILFSLLMYGLLPNNVLFWKKAAYVDVLTGPFINRNAAACFLGIVALLSIAHGSNPGRISLWQRWYFLSIAMAAFVAILLTESRGGFLALLVGCGVFFYLYTAANRVQWYICTAATCLAVFFGKSLMGRLLSLDPMHIDRTYIWSLIVENMPKFWWSGVGGGGFEYIFMAWRDPSVTQHWDHAHNMYLEMMVELGIPAACVLFLMTCYHMFVCWEKARRCPGDIAPIIGLAVISLLAVHGLVDFAPQIPANSLWGILLFGMGCGAQSDGRFEARRSKKSAPIQGPELINR